MTNKDTASGQQALRNGYRGSTMVSDFHGPKVTLRYTTSAQADAAHEVLCKLIDASAAATVDAQADTTTASASGRKEMDIWNAGAKALSDRAPAPSREAAPLEGLPTYDPDRDTPGMMELRDKYNDGDYYKVEDVRAALANKNGESHE